jgi:hypothetical protein
MSAISTNNLPLVEKKLALLRHDCHTLSKSGVAPKAIMKANTEIVANPIDKDSK